MLCRAVKPLPCWILLSLWPLCAALRLRAFAQDAPPPARSKYSVQGVVVNSANGEPVRRAIVQIFAASTQETLTDNEGRFHFDGLPATRASIIARKPGFFNPQQLNSGMQAQASVDVGPDTAEIQVKLVAESVLFGRVTSVAGEPVENIPVRVISARVTDGKRRWEQRGASNTDDDGQFRISGLMPGSYFLVAGPSWERAFQDFGVNVSAKKPRDDGYAERFYPDVTDIQSASPVELAPGQQMEADFAIKPEPLFEVSGSIAGVNQGQSVNLQFIDRSGESVYFPVRYHDNTGKFETRAPAGAYILRAHSQGAGELLIGETSVVVSSNTAGVRLVLSPSSSIPISVSIRSSHSSAARNDLNMQPVTVELSSEGLSLAQNDYWSMLEGTGKNATLIVRNVDPGKYAVDITPNGDWWVESARCGSVDLLQDNLSVAAGSRVPPIEITLRDDGAALNGTVTSAGQKTQGSVLLIPEHGPSTNAKSSFASTTGEFRFRNLAPGDYLVLALDQSVGTIEYGNPAALEPYLSKAAHLSLQPGETANVAVELAVSGQ